MHQGQYRLFAYLNSIKQKGPLNNEFAKDEKVQYYA
jgi:hypothetical protein